MSRSWRCFVFQPEGNEHREHFRYTKLFGLIPSFQVGNAEKRLKYLKKEIEFTVSECSVWCFFIELEKRFLIFDDKKNS